MRVARLGVAFSLMLAVNIVLERSTKSSVHALRLLLVDGGDLSAAQHGLVMRRGRETEATVETGELAV